MGFLQNLRPSFLEGLGPKMKRGFEKGLKVFGKSKRFMGHRKSNLQWGSGHHALC